jgi:hypothetical protein
MSHIMLSETLCAKREAKERQQATLVMAMKCGRILLLKTAGPNNDRNNTTINHNNGKRQNVTEPITT